MSPCPHGELERITDSTGALAGWASRTHQHQFALLSTLSASRSKSARLADGSLSLEGNGRTTAKAAALIQVGASIASLPACGVPHPGRAQSRRGHHLVKSSGLAPQRFRAEDKTVNTSARSEMRSTGGDGHRP